MKHPQLIIACLLTAISPFGSNAQPDSRIDHVRLRNHVFNLASQVMAGRNTGEPGQKMAGTYISVEFERAGLAQISDSGYFQPFRLYDSKQEQIQFKGVKGAVNAWAICTENTNLTDSCQIWYAGNGIRKPVIQAGPDVFVMLVPRNLGQLRDLAGHYYRSGVRNFLVVMEDQSITRMIERKKRQDGKIRLQPETVKSRFDDMTSGLDGVAMAFISPKQFAMLTGYSITIREEWNRVIQRDRVPVPLHDKYTCRHVPGVLNSIRTENVVGMLEGSSKKEEIIVVTAHYDHVGTTSKGIHAGADDNASGTAALIELAHAFSRLRDEGRTPQRSILFVAFSAEELGLFGSEYFVNSPEFKNRKAVVNVNMDMIGKSIRYGMFQALVLQQQGFTEDTTARESYVYLLNSGRKTGRYVRYSKERAAGFEGFSIDRSPGFLTKITYRYSSDHKNFHDQRIPILVYFTGLHPDYHTPGDVPEKLDYLNMWKITEIIYQTVLQIAEW